MAYISKLCISLFLIATVSSITYGLIGTQVATINVLGRVACTATGNVLAGPNSTGIAGVNVSVKCNNGQLDLGTLVTNSTGFIDGVLKGTDGVLFDPSTCVARVALPIASCTLLPPTGVLQAVLVVGGILNTLLGLIAWLVTGPWALV